MRKLHFLLFLISSVLPDMAGQTFPAGVQTTLVNGRTVFLDEYADDFLPRIRTTIHFTDHSERSWNFTLKMAITGPYGIKIQTRPGTRPFRPIVANAGEPLVLEGGDLSFCFNYENLETEGISIAQLEKDHQLPEGYYTFSMQALDYETGAILSHPAFASAYLSLPDPPALTQPASGFVVESTEGQNITFSWILPNANNNMNEAAFFLSLYEVNDQWSNPLNAVPNGQAVQVWESEAIQQQNFQYSVQQPALVKGRRYVLFVRASDAGGKSRYRNNGISAPIYFHFGYAEGDTIDLKYPEENFQFLASTPSRFIWKKPRRAMERQSVTYTLRVVELGEGQSQEEAIQDNDPFYEQTYLPNLAGEIEKTIPVTIWAGIKRMHRYAWQLRAESGSQEIAKSAVRCFTGPPAVSSFIAAGFLMTITKLSSFDSLNTVISGRCRTVLDTDQPPAEFSFDAISLESLGGDEWVMRAGSVSAGLRKSSYTLTPADARNDQAWFESDSLFLDPAVLLLGGVVHWKFPHLNTAGVKETVSSKRCRLELSNNSFLLTGNDEIQQAKSKQIALLEPPGFIFHLHASSEIQIYQRVISFNAHGVIRQPLVTRNIQGKAACISFSAVSQFHFIVQSDHRSDSYCLSENTGITAAPRQYTIDLDEELSVHEFSNAPLWKGIVIGEAIIELAPVADTRGQFRFRSLSSVTLTNTGTDTIRFFVDQNGLTASFHLLLSASDSLTFRNFETRSCYLLVKVKNHEHDGSAMCGSILIPFIDTLSAFPFRAELHEAGFNDGYLVQGLSGHSFTFNPAGNADQRIEFQIRRAFFNARAALQLDLDIQWPYFNIALNSVSGFCIWGNGDIGFEVPNGTVPLSHNSAGQFEGYSVTVTEAGAGRTGNAYGFGIRARLDLDENISGDTGPPLLQAYSICRNPLLQGTLTITQSPAVSPGQTSTVTNSANVASGFSNKSGGFVRAAEYGITCSINERTMGSFKADSLENHSVALLDGNVITQIKQIVDVLIRFKPFVKSGSVTEKEWRVLERFRKAMDNDLVDKAQTTNARGLMNFMILRAAEGLAARIAGPVENIGDIAVTRIRKGIRDGLETPVSTRIDNLLTSLFDRLGKNISVSIDESHREQLKKTLEIIRIKLAGRIKNSVTQSIESNVTSKITTVIRDGVQRKITGLIQREVRSAVLKVLTDGPEADIRLTSIYSNAADVFRNIADTIKHLALHLNMQTITKTAESLVDDAVSGIDWNALAAEIATQLVSDGVSSAVASSIAQNLGNAGSPLAASLLNTVSFDFSDLGNKLQNGQLDKIVKFDPTNIYIESPTVDLRGQLRFTKDHAQFGSCWEAQVMARIKVPKKDNPVECSAAFLSGRTKGSNSFPYWYARLQGSGFNIPLSPTPVVWDGANGYIFCRMKKDGNAIVPDAQNKFGIGCDFSFYDQPSSGKTYILNLGANASYGDENFVAELTGSVSAFNYQKSGQKYVAPGFLAGTGSLGYYKTTTGRKISANFDLTLNTSPVLCGGGNAGFDLRTPSNWKVWLGTKQQPIGVRVLCRDFLSNSAFIEMDQSSLSVGLNMNVSIAARSPWLEYQALKFRGSASLGFGYSLLTALQWDPSFTISEAYVSVWATAQLGIDYEMSGVQGTYTIAGAALSGSLLYKSTPDAQLHGSMSGSIALLGYSIGFDTDVHYSLTKQEIISN